MLKHNRTTVGDVSEEITKSWAQRYKGGVVLGLLPAGGPYPGREVKADEWMFIVRPNGKDEIELLPITQIIPPAEVQLLFMSFNPEDAHRNQYLPDIYGAKRIEAQERPSITIRENPTEVVVQTYWGGNQRLAEQVANITEEDEVGSSLYSSVKVKLLELEPQEILGGPKPFAKWEIDIFRTDLEDLLDSVTAKNFNTFVVRNIRTAKYRNTSGRLNFGIYYTELVLNKIRT